MTKELNFICAADVHLGRIVEGKNSLQRLSYVILAWERLIETCLNHYPKIDALLLAGDLIDQDALFIEMQGVVRKGITRLIEHGIPVIAIAGNHDAKTLVKLNSLFSLPEFHLLGGKGEWERKTFIFQDRRVHVDGISFTEPSMLDNPLNRYHLPAVDRGEILIGLLHCDVDVVTSRYAPVSSADFCRFPHDAWILGHIHVPQNIHDQSPFVKYCGSLQGLDIGESGSRGACVLTIDPVGRVSAKPITLAPLRWEQVVVDLSEVTSEGWEEAVLRKIEESLSIQVIDYEFVELIGVRLVFEGRIEFFRELRRNLSRFQDQESALLNLNGKSIPYFIESIKNRTRPAWDLIRISEGGDFVAVLAKKLLQYQQQIQLPHGIYEQFELRLRREPFLKQCDQSWPSENECRELCLSRGLELLDELLEQK